MLHVGCWNAYRRRAPACAHDKEDKSRLLLELGAGLASAATFLEIYFVNGLQQK